MSEWVNSSSGGDDDDNDNNNDNNNNNNNGEINILSLFSVSQIFVIVK